MKQLSSWKESPEKFWGSNEIQTHDLRDTGAMLYQLSYEALLVAGQVQVQFIPVIGLPTVLVTILSPG